MYKGKTFSVVLLAAGSSTRMGTNKMELLFNRLTPIELCVKAFSNFADEFIFVCSDSTRNTVEKIIERTQVKSFCVTGGETRRQSVGAALKQAHMEFISIHDCARCLITKQVIAKNLDCTIENGCAITSVPMVDTIRYEKSGEIIDRNGVLAAQTPQSFNTELFRKAYNAVTEECTDDAAIYHAFGHELFYSAGDRRNLKLTTPDDIEIFQSVLRDRSLEMFKVGFGEDTHRLTENRSLILGGVTIPFELGLLGHSDADVLVHAIIDAILGTCSLGDIGKLFPDSEAEFKDISSLVLLRRTVDKIIERGFSIINIDATVIAQKPKLGQYREEMRQNIAKACKLSIDDVSVKFTTPEHVGPEGRMECMTTRAVAFVRR